MSKALLTTIIHLHKQGERNVATAKKLCVMRMALRRSVKPYQELGIVKNRPRSGRPRHELEFYPYKLLQTHIMTGKMKVNR
uniref:HTH_Tnp_Tc3_1 domain-containing protein n=1 Tax=Heterorhabditis bacteriophora TaxID=37862 RepID=A0A1I7XV63_HETBA